MTGVVFIARCPEHGLHGDRDECFVCGGPVEKVAMCPVPASGPLCEAPRGPGAMDLDASREIAPDPQWLRQLAETLKFEAAMLDGYMESRPVADTLWLRARLARTRLEAAAVMLLKLAVELEGPVAA